MSSRRRNSRAMLRCLKQISLAREQLDKQTHDLLELQRAMIADCRQWNDTLLSVNLRLFEQVMAALDAKGVAGKTGAA